MRILIVKRVEREIPEIGDMSIEGAMVSDGGRLMKNVSWYNFNFHISGNKKTVITRHIIKRILYHYPHHQIGIEGGYVFIIIPKPNKHLRVMKGLIINKRVLVQKN